MWLFCDLNNTVFTLNIWTPLFFTILVLLWTSPFNNPLMCLQTAGWVADYEDPDQMPHSVKSDMSLHCVLRPVYPRYYSKISKKKKNLKKLSHIRCSSIKWHNSLIDSCHVKRNLLHNFCTWLAMKPALGKQMFPYTWAMSSWPAYFIVHNSRWGWSGGAKVSCILPTNTGLQ